MATDDPFEEFDVWSGSERDCLMEVFEKHAPPEHIKTLYEARGKDEIWHEEIELPGEKLKSFDDMMEEHLILRKETEMFAELHGFNINRSVKPTALDLKEYLRDIYDYARAIGMGHHQAKLEVKRARAEYRQNHGLAKTPWLNDTDDELTVGLDSDLLDLYPLDLEAQVSRLFSKCRQTPRQASQSRQSTQIPEKKRKRATSKNSRVYDNAHKADDKKIEQTASDHIQKLPSSVNAYKSAVEENSGTNKSGLRKYKYAKKHSDLNPRDSTTDSAFSAGEKGSDGNSSKKPNPSVTRSASRHLFSSHQASTTSPITPTKLRDGSKARDSQRALGPGFLAKRFEEIAVEDLTTSPYFTPPASEVKVKVEQLEVKKRPLRPGLVSCIPFPPLEAERFGLLQEKLAHDPLRLLVGVTFLNRTHGKHAIPVFFKLMDQYPTPEALANAQKEDIVAIIHHLGLQSQRADTYIRYAKHWIEDPPVKGRRHKVKDYPEKGDHAGIMKGEILDDADPRVGAWEIGHITQGRYALDSWRIFCRDKLRGLANGWNGEDAEENFQPEWMRVVPQDKELRAFLRWMWLKEGFDFDPITGEKEVASKQLMEAAMAGRIAWDDAGGMRIIDEEEIKKESGLAGDVIILE